MIKVYPSHIVFCQDNSMISRHFLDSMDRHCPFFIELVQIKNIPFLAHLDKLYKDLRRTLCVVYRPVVIFQGNPYGLRYRIQLKPV